MKGLFIFVLFIFVKRTDAACYFIEKTGQFNGCPVSVNGVNVVIHVNSTVEIMQPRCERCSCGNTGASCCSLHGRPVEFPNDCELIFNGCKPLVVKKNDCTVQCQVTAWIG